MTSPRLMIVAGIVLILGGVFAIIAPLAASLAVTLFVGWFFIIQGGIGLYAAFKDSTDRGWQIAMSLLGLLLGLSFILNPLGGLFSLTIVVGAIFAASGATRLWMAYKGSFGVPRWVLILSGIASLALGALMMFGTFGPGAVALGFIIAFEMLSMGTGLVAMGWRGDDPGTIHDPREELALPPEADRPASEQQLTTARTMEQGNAAEPRTKPLTDAAGNPVRRPAGDPSTA
ncbi:MAG: HdeD family acid-resistance protein [Shimia sp.]